jgi:hypothetical protein
VPKIVQRSAGKVATFRFGALKGTPLSEAPLKDLEWYSAAVARGIEDPEKAQYRTAAVAHHKEVIAALAAIAAEAGTAAPPPGNSLDEDFDSDDIPF